MTPRPASTPGLLSLEFREQAESKMSFAEGGAMVALISR